MVSTSAEDEIARSVRRRVRESAGRERADVSSVISEEVRRYTEAALAGHAPVPADDAATLRQVRAAVSGFGELQALLDDPEVEELWVNAPDRVFVARNGRSERVDVTLAEGELRRLIERILRVSGRRIDLASPFVDAYLEDGSRVHVVIPDITAQHPALNIRKFVVTQRGLTELARRETLDPEAIAILREEVRSGSNILISGATHSGKTTLLRALAAEYPEDTRIITIEETFELALTGSDVVAMQCREAGVEGVGAVTLRRLVKESLRMRPERLIVGEVRGAEALDLVLALNSGVPGMCTVHANSPADALGKLALLPLLAAENVTAEFIGPTLARSIHVVVHCQMHDGRRVVTAIAKTRGTVSEGAIEHDLVYCRS